MKKAAYFLNWETQEWTQVADMDAPRALAGCGVARNPDRVIVIAGYDEEYDMLRSSVIYDVASDSWSGGPDHPNGYIESVETVAFGDSFLMIGGNGEDYDERWDVVYEFDAVNNEFVARPEKLSQERKSVVAVPFPDSLQC